MPRTALFKMRRRTKGLISDERASVVKASERFPLPPRRSRLQTIESRYMNTFWIMMSMLAPIPLIKNSL